MLYPDIIYIPFNPDNVELLEQRKRLLNNFIKDGWELLGSIKLKDRMGEETHVWILRK